MIELPAILPAGTSYVRIPRSKSATLRVILETVERGSRYWTGGVIPAEKALRLAEKFAQYYGTDHKQSRRAWDKARGRANAHLIMYPENDQALTPLRWWLLVTPGEGIIHREEQLKDSWEKRQRPTWGEQYELVHLQRDRRYGGGRHWTWCMTERRYRELEVAMRQYARGHGRTPAVGSEPSPTVGTHGKERSNDLQRMISAITKMPGFHGIRMQQMALYRLGREEWDRTHRTAYPDWPADVPYVDKRQPVYHRPMALMLDTLVRLYQRQRLMA